MHDIKFVTYESLAYVATVVSRQIPYHFFVLTSTQTRFALSDDLIFSPGGPGSSSRRQRDVFPYREFYRELLEHKSLMSRDESEEFSSLMRWWTE